MSAAKIGQKQYPNLLGFFQSERESISAVRQIYEKVMNEYKNNPVTYSLESVEKELGL